MCRSLFVLVLTILLTGCAGYKLGSTNGLEAGSRSIQINPPFNTTFEPRLAVALNQQLRKQLQRDGTYRLDTKGEGDVVVTTTILHYNKIGESFQPRASRLTIASRARTSWTTSFTAARPSSPAAINRARSARRCRC
jgi:hypothetical protein